jgi:hypothetical protein
LEHDYVLGALGRFNSGESTENKFILNTATVVEMPELFPDIAKKKGKKKKSASVSSDLWYKINHPACLWNENDASPLAIDGGKLRILRKKTPEQMEAKLKARMKKGRVNGTGQNGKTSDKTNQRIEESTDAKV